MIIRNIILFGLFSPLALLAQAVEDSKSEEIKGRTAAFIYTSWPDGAENPITLLAGNKTSELRLSKRSASQPVKVPPNGMLRIVREVANPENPEQPLYQTLGQVIVPENVQHALVVLNPAKKAAENLLFSAQVLDLANFKGGDYLFINLSPINIGVQIGEDRLGIPPKDYKVFSAPASDRSENASVGYFFYDAEESEWRLLSASTVVLRPTRREICIFSWDPRRERVGYHGITIPNR